MQFYDVDPNSLPEGAHYYHNVLVFTIGVGIQNWPLDNIESIWYLDRILDPYPVAILFYKNPELEQETDNEEIDFDMTFYPHSVVEVIDNEVSWYTVDQGQIGGLNDLWKL